MERENWFKSRQYTPEMLLQARQVLEEVRRGAPVEKALRRHPIPQGGYLAKHVLVAAYRQLTETGEWASDPGILERIRMKPVRTLSGGTRAIRWSCSSWAGHGVHTGVIIMNGTSNAALMP